jgi:protein-S-isoprenylcysteine O-methyltransferase Ste14
LVAFAGISLLLQTLWGFILLPELVWLMTLWVIVPEEKYLESTFGEPYRQYKAMVRRWT